MKSFKKWSRREDFFLYFLNLCKLGENIHGLIICNPSLTQHEGNTILSDQSVYREGGKSGTEKNGWQVD